MKNLTLSLLTLLMFSGVASAQTTDDNRRPPRPPQEVLQQFDVDGDGQLNETERQALRESRAGQRPPQGQMLERFDTDGDGQLSQSEREAARQARPSCTGRGQRGRRGGGGR